MLGSPLKSYGLNIYEAFQRAFGVALLIWAFNDVVRSRLPPPFSTLDLTQFTIIYIFIFIIVFMIYLLYEILTRPRITIYENGIGVTQKGEEKTWRWNQINRMDGTRQYTYVYGFLRVGGYGFNQFYAGEEKAFRIEVLTAGASELADYIFMKMAECQLPQLIQRYQNGEKLDFGNFHLSKQGIITGKETIPWSEVRSVSYKDETFRKQNTSVQIEREGKPGRQKIGTATSAFVLYSVMSVFDSILHTSQLSDAQAKRLKGGLRISRRMRVMTVLYAAIILLIIGIFGGQEFLKQQRLQQAQSARDTFATSFGPDTASLCQPVKIHTANSNTVSAPDPHFVIMDVNEESIYQPFDLLLTDSERATSRLDLTTAVCVDVSNVRIESCAYEDHQSYYKEGVFRFTVDRYRTDIDVYIVDVDSSTMIARTTLRGSKPDTCPDKASIGANDIYGSPPPASDFESWFRQMNPAQSAFFPNES